MFAFAVQPDSVSKVFILHHDWVDAKCQVSRFEIVGKVSVGPESVVSLAWDVRIVAAYVNILCMFLSNCSLFLSRHQD